MDEFRQEKIRVAREMAGLTVEEVAAYCETTVTSIRNWESNKYRPNAEMVGRLARLFRRPISYFYRARA